MLGRERADVLNAVSVITILRFGIICPFAAKFLIDAI
jgi:hypothetical protein